MFVRCLIDSEELMSTTVCFMLYTVSAYCNGPYPWIVWVNGYFFLIFLDIQVPVGSVKVLEKFLWGSWKVLEKSWIFFQWKSGNNNYCSNNTHLPDDLGRRMTVNSGEARERLASRINSSRSWYSVITQRCSTMVCLMTPQIDVPLLCFLFLHF